jgi:hypothetical protein
MLRCCRVQEVCQQRDAARNEVAALQKVCPRCSLAARLCVAEHVLSMPHLCPRPQAAPAPRPKVSTTCRACGSPIPWLCLVVTSVVHGCACTEPFLLGLVAVVAPTGTAAVAPLRLGMRMVCRSWRRCRSNLHSSRLIWPPWNQHLPCAARPSLPLTISLATWTLTPGSRLLARGTAGCRGPSEPLASTAALAVTRDGNPALPRCSAQHIHRKHWLPTTTACVAFQSQLQVLMSSHSYHTPLQVLMSGACY